MLITGGTGRLGQALNRVFPSARFPGRLEFDVCNDVSVHTYLKHNPPSVLLHTAAMTDVRLAQRDHETCWNTNVKGTERLVNALQIFAPNCYFVYLSTACVFQGDVGNYSESDVPNPKNFYGLSKLIGEYVASRMPHHLIVRTNFVAREPWPFPKAFVDRFGTYLFADDVAVALRQLVNQNMEGLVHVAGDKRMSMFELAKLTSPDVGSMHMADVNMPLTVDMTLRSERIPAFRIGESELS